MNEYRATPISHCRRICARSTRPNIRGSATRKWRGGALAIASLLEEASLDHLVYCGANRFGSAVQWLTGWPVTAEAVGVFTPGKPDALFVQHVNHVPLARRLAAPAEVAWGGGSSIAAAIAALEHRAARTGRVGVIGPMTFEQHEMLAARFGSARESQSPLRAAAPDQVRGRARLAAHRRRLDRSRHERAARRPAAGLERARSRRSGRAVLCGARRHQRHSLFRRHADGRATAWRADAIRRQPQGRARRRRRCRDHRRVLGASRPGAAQLCGRRRSAAALSRSACGRRRRVRRDCRHAQGRRHAAAGDRRRRRHREGRLHHH